MSCRLREGRELVKSLSKTAMLFSGSSKSPNKVASRGEISSFSFFNSLQTSGYLCSRLYRPRSPKQAQLHGPCPNDDEHTAMHFVACCGV